MNPDKTGWDLCALAHLLPGLHFTHIASKQFYGCVSQGDIQKNKIILKKPAY